MKRSFRGVVFSGVGEGEFFVNLYAERIRAVLGFTPYPGTLNIRITEDAEGFNSALGALDPITLDPPVIEGMRLGRVLAYPAVLNWTVDVYIVRPEITVYKGGVAEVISEYRLRDLLNLVDGSIVEVSLADPERVTWASRRRSS